MITKEQKVRLSIFLAVAAVLFILIVAAFIYPKLKEKGDIYYINFKGTSVHGLNKGSDVKYQGVKIGMVEDIEVDEKGQVESFCSWLRRNRRCVVAISENQGCGCCVHMFQLVLRDCPQEMPCEAGGTFDDASVLHGPDRDRIIQELLA